MNTSQQQLFITEDKYITPLVEVLDQVTPKPTETPSLPKGPSKTLNKSLDELFPEQQYDKKIIQEAKKILGAIADEFTPDQLKDAVTEIQYLASTWLDDFERDAFDGLTLNELLHEKGAR